MARSCCSMNQPLFNTELLSFILIQSCCLVFLPFSLIQSCCLVFLPFSLIQSCCLIVISMQYHYTPHQSHMQICRILPPQYAEDKIFGRTRKMCRRWRLCSFPRVVVFGRRRLLLPQPSPGGPRERFLVDSLRGGPPSASSQILRRLRFSGAPQPLSLRYSTILHLPPAVCGGALRSSCSLPARATSVPASCDPFFARIKSFCVSNFKEKNLLAFQI